MKTAITGILIDFMQNLGILIHAANFISSKNLSLYAEFHQTGVTQLHKWEPVSCMNGIHLIS